MKAILIALAMLVSWPCVAQIESLAVYGAMAGVNALRKKPQDAQQYVTLSSYQGNSFAQKRTPAEKIPKKGGAEIVALERFLAQHHALLLASDTTRLLIDSQTAGTQAMLMSVRQIQPMWNTTPYEDELGFYRRQDIYRRIKRDDVARKLVYRQQELQRHRSDSLAVIALNKRQAQNDSLAQHVQATFVNLNDLGPSTGHYVPITEANTPHAAGGKVVRVTTTAKTAPHRSVPHKTVVHSTQKTGTAVYYCASGNTVKYHASPDCRGLNRCNASIVKMGLRQAQQEMDPCKFCY